MIEELSFICSGDVRDEKHRAAVRALQTLDSAIIQRKNIRVLTAEGKDVTRQITGRGHLNAQVGNDRASIDDVVVGVARQQSGLNKDTAGAVSGPQEGAEAAVLVTDMESMSLKAQASGVRAMASSKLWNILDLVVPGAEQDLEGKVYLHSCFVATASMTLPRLRTTWPTISIAWMDWTLFVSFMPLCSIFNRTAQDGPTQVLIYSTLRVYSVARVLFKSPQGLHY